MFARSAPMFAKLASGVIFPKPAAACRFQKMVVVSQQQRFYATEDKASDMKPHSTRMRRPLQKVKIWNSTESEPIRGKRQRSHDDRLLDGLRRDFPPAEGYFYLDEETQKLKDRLPLFK